MLHPILNLLVDIQASLFILVFSLFAACTKPMMTCNSSNCFSMGKSKLEFRRKLDHVRMQVGGSERTILFINLGHEVPLNSINQLLPGRIRTCILLSKCSQLTIKHNWDS